MNDPYLILDGIILAAICALAALLWVLCVLDDLHFFGDEISFTEQECMP